MKLSRAHHDKTPENTCVMCKEIYDVKDITYEQRIVADKDFCPICWHRDITTFSDDSFDFSYLEGLANNKNRAQR